MVMGRGMAQGDSARREGNEHEAAGRSNSESERIKEVEEAAPGPAGGGGGGGRRTTANENRRD